jgi:hypothetical protein
MERRLAVAIMRTARAGWGKRRPMLAGAASLFVDAMSAHVIASLDLSPFFDHTMVAGVALLAAPAIVGFYISVAGRSLVGRRFDLVDTFGATTHT